MSRRWQVFGLMAFALVLLDSMLTYLLRGHIGMVRVNALLPVIVYAFTLKWGIRAITPSPQVLVALGVGFCGFVVAIILRPDLGVYRIANFVSALSAFLIGYFATRWTDNEESYANVLVFVGSLYMVVCFLALLEVFPSLFPVKKIIGLKYGVSVIRPEVTTDQNVQVFYLFPIVLVLSLPYRTARFLTVLIGSAGALYVLNVLKSRSGFLVFLGAIVLSLIAPLFTKGLGKIKVIVLPILITCLVLLSVNFIIEAGAPIMDRFFHDDMDTFHGRVMSFTYLIKHLPDPTYWIPQGNADFIRLSGGPKPHSNPTAMFLEGGIFGLYMWIIVFVVPLLRLFLRFFRRELNPLATLILIGGVVSFVTQMSLNVPFFEQVWLWAGAVLGVLYRSAEPQENPQTETLVKTI